MTNYEAETLTSAQTVSENEFGTKKITPLFWKYSLFALAGLILQTSSVVADGTFVGNGLGEIGLATIGVINPFWVITVSLMGLFGIGGSTIAATKLGEGDVEGARKVYGTIVIFTFFLSVLIAILALLNLEKLLTLLGATPEILPSALDYAVPYLIGFPICVTGSATYYFARADGQPLPSAIAYMLPAVIAIILEYIMICKMGCGMEGAAIPWVVCVGLSVLLVPYLQIKGHYFKIKASDFKIDFKIVGNAVKIGFAYFAIQICTTISTIIINNQIIATGGSETEIAAFGTINAYIAYILVLITTAFISGLQPIASFNKGTKNFKRVAELIKVSIVQSGIALIALVALAFLFAEPLVKFFVGNDAALVNTTVEIMKVYMILYAIGNISQLVSGYYQAVSKNGLAILNGIARIILFAVPLLFILPNIFGISGIWMAQPSADLLAFILAGICIIHEYKQLRKTSVTLNA